MRLARENPHFRGSTPKNGGVQTEYTRAGGETGLFSANPHTFTACILDIIDILSVLAVLGLVWHSQRKQQRRQRTALLASQLQPFQIERLMQQLTEAYMRALGENDPQRQAQIWQLQQEAEQQLARQFQAFARAFAQVPAPQARTLKSVLPGIERILPNASFDTRRVLQVHADGIERVVRNDAGHSLREKAFTLMAEMFLMQHSCHWFCRSKAIASARMLVQHKTQYEQALQAVTAQTRQAYLAVVQGPALAGSRDL